MVQLTSGMELRFDEIQPIGVVILTFAKRYVKLSGI